MLQMCKGVSHGSKMLDDHGLHALDVFGGRRHRGQTVHESGKYGGLPQGESLSQLKVKRSTQDLPESLPGLIGCLNAM